VTGQADARDRKDSTAAVPVTLNILLNIRAAFPGVE
jgi:hypothetical protein